MDYLIRMSTRYTQTEIMKFPLRGAAEEYRITFRGHTLAVFTVLEYGAPAAARKAAKAWTPGAVVLGEARETLDLIESLRGSYSDEYLDRVLTERAMSYHSSGRGLFMEYLAAYFWGRA